jgi:UDP-glucuronate decarboxylase
VISVVTGGAGFVGSHLVDALLRRENEVVILDNLSTGNLRNIETATMSGKASFVFLDVAQSPAAIRSALQEALRNRPIGEIYHLASPASPDAYGAHPWETLSVNGIGTMSLVEIALEHRARFIYSSTSEIYGDPLVHPQPESYFGNVDPIGPRACYDEGKRFAEAAVSVAVRARGLDGRLVRFFNCYGPRMSPADGRLIPSFSEAAFGGRPFPIHGSGRQTRSMTYIDDAIRLLLRVMDAPQASLQPINIGNDEERTVLDIAETFARVAQVPFAVEHVGARPGDPQRRKPDLTLARGLGWEPIVSLEEGLRMTLPWLRDVPLTYA